MTRKRKNKPVRNWSDTRARRGKIDGICHICKQAADGPPMFQTRFCYTCFVRGMTLEEEESARSPYAIIPTLFRIKIAYNDVIVDIDRAISSLLQKG